MLTSLITVLALSPLQGAPTQAAPAQAAPGTSAVEVVQKMLARYSDATSAVGTIKLVQSAQNVTITIDTKLAFDRGSNRLLLEQVRRSGEAGRTFAVSDGVLFSYDKPEGVIGTDRFVEEVAQHGQVQTVRDLYAAARPGIADANAILDIAIARQIDLKAIMGQWVTMKVHSKVDVNGKPATVIVGDYAVYPLQPPTGTYEAYVTDDSQLTRYVVKQNVGAPSGGQDANGNPIFQTISVTSVWNSDIKLNEPVEASLFKVPR